MNAPDFILYAQHGWADNATAIASLAKAVASPNTKIIAPSLGWVQTWLRIEPLIKRLEKIVAATIEQHPHTPMRIIGHSMGGAIWLELLHRHPEWRSRVESLVLVASSVGGADLARIIDPLGIGIGIARDLGIDRRAIAEAIAAEIPTLAIAGDIDGGSDGTIVVGSTQFPRAQFTCLQGLSHVQLKNSPQLVPLIHQFWENPVIPPEPPFDLLQHLIRSLRSVPGMTDAHPRDFSNAKIGLRFEKGITLRTGKNPFLGIDYVFLADAAEKCAWGGFVGWLHGRALRDELEALQRDFSG